jgi:group I intron endonuclease
MIVYKAVNKINGKMYVGATQATLSRRISYHLCSKAGIFPGELRKFGVNMFEFSILDVAEDRKTLHEKEKYWIRKLDCVYPKGYNQTAGGLGMLGVKDSEVTRKRKSEALKGKNVGEKNGMFGNKAYKQLLENPEYKQKAIARLHRDFSPEARRELSDRAKKAAARRREEAVE